MCSIPIMRMSSAVEWCLHCCVTLGWVSELGPAPITRLAAWFGLPPEYLKKRLQPLVKAGILDSIAGRSGGYRLARSPESITMMDVVAAVEGGEPAFRCAEIRRGGLSGENRGEDYQHACGISVAMHRAELAWRRELAAQTIADLMGEAPKGSADRVRRRFAHWRD